MSATQKKIRDIDYDPQFALKLLLPSLLVMGIVIFYPLVHALGLSFYNYQLMKPDAIRLDPLFNYTRILKDSTFWVSIRNTVVFTFFTVSISLIWGLIIALAIDQVSKSLSYIRGILLLPWVLPGIVVGYLFMYMFDVEVGIINYLLHSLGFIQKFLPWLMHHQLAMVAIIIAHVWNQTPFYMLMFSTGLIAISSDEKEAAIVEGATYPQLLRFIILPHLKGIMVITSLLMIIRNFNNFPIIFTMTGGGPAYATTTSVIHIYRQAFQQYDFGYASTTGIFWVLILLTLSIVYIKLLQRDF